jgi:hypothetical protein
MTSDSDYDPQSTQATVKGIHELLADKGYVLGSGKVAVQGPRGGPEAAADAVGTVVHEVAGGTYIDMGGHLHAVLYDQVTTINGGSASTVLEILSDVTVS